MTCLLKLCKFCSLPLVLLVIWQSITTFLISHRFEGKLRGRISYMSALEKTKNKGVDVFKFTVFDGADELSGVAYGSVAGKLVNKFLVCLRFT